MTKPEDIDHIEPPPPGIAPSAWEQAKTIFKEMCTAAEGSDDRHIIARAIMSARGEERSLFTDAGCDHDALTSAVDVLRTQQAQPHRSSQHVLWEAIKDYAERAAIRNRP